MPRNRTTDSDVSSKGPWTFKLDSIDPGKSKVYDFRQMVYNNSKGYFRPYLPLDIAMVYNQSAENLINVESNGVYEVPVMPNSQWTDDDLDTNRMEITNEGSTTIAAGEIILTVKRSQYDSDDHAKDRASGNVFEKAAQDIIPGL